MDAHSGDSRGQRREAAISTDRPPHSTEFPSRISRRLSVALGAIIATVLLVGGISLALALRIFQINTAVDRENTHIQLTYQIHSTFHQTIFELQQMHVLGWSERRWDAQKLQRELTQHLEAFRVLHRREEDFPEGRQELVLFAGLRRLAGELREITDRALAAGGGVRLEPMDLAHLNIMAQQAVRHVEDLDGIHRAKVTGLLRSSQRMMWVIIALYLAFILVGGASIVVASMAFTRGIAAPLRVLADASLRIAEGHLDERVPVRSPNEIGQLSRAFNVMADRLQGRERDLRTAHTQLERNVSETQALYRIGTEISRLHEIDEILQSVVAKARELLRSEAAALCMFTPEPDELASVAISGSAEAFRSEAPPAKWNLPSGRAAVTLGDVDGQVLRCTIMQPEYLPAHLAAPLCRGDSVIGIICVGGREPRVFTAAETELLTGLATQAAIAIENARLYEEVRSLATLEERERIAREMHDGLAQALGLLHMKLRRAQEGPASSNPPHMAEALQEMTAIADGAYEEVRQSIFGLRTMVSRGLGLIPTLTEFLHEFSAQNGIAVELQVTEGRRAIHLSPGSEVQLVRIIQEALANVRKHAGAGHARVCLQRLDPWVRVTIEDDGRGFEPPIPGSPDGLHFGLQTMRERAEGRGGKLEIDTAPGRGTRIVATLPSEV